MKSFKKSIVFLMVAALVFGTVAPAFAATPTDVVATTYEDAVGKMVALGIINGYEDGTFQPEKTITRAEFAKIACYVVGQQDAANLSKGAATKFSDVPSTHWASGFVSVAASQGLLKGYPNGTFKPEANVSYAEAITILVRALGMAPVVEGKGTWPANYMAKASEIGMFKEVAGLTGTDNAIRGNIAKLAWNTLEADKWGADGYNDKGEVTYGSLNKSLLSYSYKDFATSNGDVKLYEDVKVVATRIIDNNLNDNEVVLSSDVAGTGTSYVGDEVADNYDYNHDGDKLDKVTLGYVYKEADGVDLSRYIGSEADVLLGKDNKVAYVKANDTIVAGKLEDVKFSPNRVVVNGKEYELAIADGQYLVNYTLPTASYDTFAKLDNALDTKNIDANLVVDADNNKVVSMSVVIPDASTQFVVKEIKSNGVIMRAPNSNTSIDLDEITNGDSKDRKETIFVKNGKLATRNDIKAGDVVSVFGDFFFITDNKVTGKVTAISGKNELTVNGVKYTMSTNALMTKNGKVEDAIPVGTTITDYLNKDVTLSLNVVGEYMLVSGSVTATANEQYGLLTKAVWTPNVPNAAGKLEYYMEVRTTTGEKKVYTLTGSDDEMDYYVKGVVNTNYGASGTERNLLVNATYPAATPAGTLVQFQVGADSKVAAKDLVIIDPSSMTNLPTYYRSNVINEYVSDYAGIQLPVAVVSTTVNDEAKSVSYNGHTYYFSDVDSVALNAADQDKEANWDAISSSDAKNLFVTGAGNPGAPAYVIYDKDTYVIKVVVVKGTALSSSDLHYGIVTDPIHYGIDSDNNSVAKINLFDGSDKELTLDTKVTNFTYAATTAVPAVGDVLCYQLTSDGKIQTSVSEIVAVKKLIVDNAEDSVVDNNNYHYDQLYVKSFNDNIIIYDNSGTSKKIESDAKVFTFDANGKPVVGSLSDIKAGALVVTFDSESAGSTGYGIDDVVVVLAE